MHLTARVCSPAGGDHSQSASALPSPRIAQTLDSQTRMLSAQTLLITANDQPVALAGVMGEETEVHDGTQSLV